MEKWKGLYRIPSARASWWNYADEGAYFITVCTESRVHYFGQCKDGKMRLSIMGVIAQGLWYEIPNQFDYIRLGAFVVVPNHIHGILILETPDHDRDHVETRLIASLPSSKSPSDSSNGGGITGDKNPMLNDNISRVIRWYKARCTHDIRTIHADFGWQSRFWDNIIRDENAYLRISNYIQANPLNWDKDKFFE